MAFRMALLIVAVLAALGAGGAHAAILTVDTTLDVIDGGDGVLSLREALADANPGDEIQFDATLNGQTIVLGGSELVIDVDLSVTGPGPGANQVTIDGDLASRVLLVEAGVTATVSGLTLTRGDTSGLLFGDMTGAGVNNRGALELRDVIVSNSVGPANKVGAGIVTTGSMLLTRCVVSGSDGEGIRHQAGPFTMLDSTVSGHLGSGLVKAASTFETRIVRSTFVGNSGGAGGAINNSSTTGLIVIINSTISGNTATNRGGGIWAGGSPLTVLSTTITSNTATNDGGGISRGSSFNDGDVVLRNSIVAGNTAPADADCSVAFPNGQWVTDDHNLFGVGTGCPVGASDETTADVSTVLTALADNGGETQTHALIVNVLNPALDGGNPNDCRDDLGGVLTTDQRGLQREVGAGCDIGAYEDQTRRIPSLPGAALALLGAALMIGGVLRAARR